MHPPQPSPVTLFARELNKAEPALDRLALYIAQIEYPDLDVDDYVAQVDALSQVVMDGLRSKAPGHERALHFLTIFNDELNFRGNTENYYEADNSFVNRVLTRRVGLPILLSLVCVAIGDRMRRAEWDIDLQGVGLPSHFMVRYTDGAGVWLLDPFYGEVLPPEEVARYLSSLFKEQLNGKILELPANILRPVSLQMLLYRVLNNLRVVYLESARYKLALRVMDYMLELVTDDPQLWKERGLLNHHCNNLEQASRDLRRYFFLNEQWMVATGLHDELELDAPAVYLTKSDLLDQYTDDDSELFDSDLLDGDVLDGDTLDVDTLDGEAVEESTLDNSILDNTLENDETDEVDIIAWDMHPHDDLDQSEEYEFIELTDEEYQLVNVLADIESLRISLN